MATATAPTTEERLAAVEKEMADVRESVAEVMVKDVLEGLTETSTGKEVGEALSAVLEKLDTDVASETESNKDKGDAAKSPKKDLLGKLRAGLTKLLGQLGKEDRTVKFGSKKTNATKTVPSQREPDDLSAGAGTARDATTTGGTENLADPATEDAMGKRLDELLKQIKDLGTTVKSQAEEIARLKGTPPTSQIPETDGGTPGGEPVEKGEFDFPADLNAESKQMDALGDSFDEGLPKR